MEVGLADHRGSLRRVRCGYVRPLVERVEQEDPAAERVDDAHLGSARDKKEARGPGHGRFIRRVLSWEAGARSNAHNAGCRLIVTEGRSEYEHAAETPVGG